jgi:secreted trypsin-like serine protease
MILLAIAIGTEKSIKCSGTLIHPKIVLTAGHCNVKPGELVAKIDSQGKWNIRTVSKVIINETYTKTYSSSGISDLNSASDLSLLLLESGYENVREILPKSEPRLNGTVIVSGFGRNETNTLDGKLRTASLTLSNLVKPSKFDTYASLVLDKQTKAVNCSGDSGGPGVQDGAIVGVHESGVGRGGICGNQLYSMQVSVWHAMPWITANMNALLGSPQSSSTTSYVDSPPPNACSQATGVFDVAPNVIRDVDTGEPGLICSDGNPQTADPIIRCTSSIDPNSCKNTGLCLLNGAPISCVRTF